MGGRKREKEREDRGETRKKGGEAIEGSRRERTGGEGRMREKIGEEGEEERVCWEREQEGDERRRNCQERED